MQYTFSAPSRRHTRIASIAVLPAPTTVTRWPSGSGVSKFGNSLAPHQVAARQQFVGRQHAVQRIAGNAEHRRIAGADADEHRVEAHLVDHLLDGEQAADQRVALELDAEFLQLVDLRVDHFVGQAEIRNAVAQHAARLVEGFVDGHVAPGLGHVRGAGHAGRTRADDADPVRSRFDIRDIGPAFRDRLVADPALEASDGHRFQRVADGAHAFALVFLRTDAAADGRQQVGVGQDVVGAAKILLADLLDETGNVDTHRAACDARLFGHSRQRSDSRSASSRLKPQATSEKFLARTAAGCSRIGVRSCGMVRIVFFLAMANPSNDSAIIRLARPAAVIHCSGLPTHAVHPPATSSNGSGSVSLRAGRRGLPAS